MKLSNHLNLLFFNMVICLTLGQTAKALTDWPNERLTTLRNNNYSPQCAACTKSFSKAYCSDLCCTTCQASAADQSLNIAASCNSICSVEVSSNPDDRDLVNTCKSTSFMEPGCQELIPFIDGGEQVLLKRAFERRKESCNTAVNYTKKYCSLGQLTAAYPVDLFRLAKDLSKNQDSCDLDQIEKYNLSTESNDPKDLIKLCETNYDDCKSFCYDHNIVYGAETGPGTLINTDGHKKYEDICKPMFAEFQNQKEIREDAIKQANDIAVACNSSETEDKIASDEKKEVADPNKAVNNPEVALSNANQILSAIKPYLPQAQSNNYLNSEIARNSAPLTGRNSISDRDYYGEVYEGGSAGDADDVDFILDDDEFDRPQNLANQQRPGGRPQAGPGANGGGLQASGGQGNAGGSTGGSRRARQGGRALQKDKSLFGKKEESPPNNYTQWQKTQNARLNSKNLNQSRKKNKIFNASKYHDLIIASYDKGMRSNRQKLAVRAAAGHASASKASAYTAWHSEYKIHPESVSLFIQAKICYLTKYSTNFSRDCSQ